MSPASSFVGAFDLNSQNGVMSVLASIRASQISPADKNELRDLVFLYTNGGGDTSVKLALEQKLSAHQIMPVSVKQAASSGPALAFGSYRPTPTFKAPTPMSVQSAPAPAPAPVIPQIPVPVVTSAPQVPQPVPQPVASVPVTPPQPPTQQPPQSVPVPEPTPVPPVPIQSSVPVPPQPQPQFQSAQSVAPEDLYLNRIRQIKTAVNSKVGNPVNLVDINNEVGREYMNALLEAMKKLSSGAVSEMEPAMARLESSFAQVELAIQAHQASGSTTLVTNPAPITPVVPVSSSPTEPVTTVPTPPVPVQPVNNYNVATTVNPTPPVAPAPLPTRQVAPAAPVPVVEPLSVRETPQPVVVTSAQAIPINDVSEPDPVETLKAATVVTNETFVEEQSGFEDSSLANTGQKVLTPKDLPDPASLETSEDGDPLFTKEVDDGLEQLLADWSLFKKSGLFGTGPKGREHPLFKKIADLQVPLLLAGRFEGSTQEVRQSVTDYMNGWRYEQGIIYSPGETFEKYLRRVIKHILDLQKSRK